MKRYAVIAAVGLALALSFCLGAATSKPAKKFPYASDKLNEEVTMTRLELECLEKRWMAGEPMKYGILTVVGMSVRPEPRAIVLRIDISPFETMHKGGEAARSALIDGAYMTQVAAKIKLLSRADEKSATVEYFCNGIQLSREEQGPGAAPRATIFDKQ